MPNVYICSRSCRRRGLDATKIQTYFILNGHKIVHNPKKADYIFFVACGFHGDIAEECSRKIQKLQKYDAELIVAGCLPLNSKDVLKKVFDGRTLGTKDIDRIDDFFPENKVKFKDVEDANFVLDTNHRYYKYKRLLEKNKFFYKTVIGILDILYRVKSGKNSFHYNVFPIKPLFHVRIAWGCDSKCTYCVIRKSTGPFHSKPFEKCIEEFKLGLSQGYKLFLLTAVNSGCYGMDIGHNFPELLDEITKISGSYKIIIRGIYPNWLIKYIDELEEIAKRKKIKVFGIPIQSGSSRILKMMKRTIDLDKLADACIRLQRADPDMIVDTHYIIGFPTETEEDFEKTLNLAKKIDSRVVYFFPFSCRAGTGAEHLEPKVSVGEIQNRINKTKQVLTKKGYKAKTVLDMGLPLFEKE